tara:strand:- start:814 stop:1140 length:327 start_codon:yes stop_codon:yes gene_type:complete
MKNMVKEVKEALTVHGTKFIVEGSKGTYRRKEEFDTSESDLEVGEWGNFPVVFEVHADSSTTAIYGEFRGMNVDKFGPTCVWLYTYDMLGSRTSGKIKYSDVTLLEKA